MLKNLYKLLDFLSKPFRRTDILVSYVLIPLGILTSYFISSSWLLPSGVNNVFVTRSGKYLLAFTIFLYLVFFIFVNHLHIKKLTLIFSVEKAYVGDPTLLLLPLTPVVQYIIINREILSLLDSLYIFSFFAFIVALFILILPILLSIIGSRSTVMLLGLAFTFSITNMATLTQHFAWYEVGSLKVQLPVFSGVFLVCWFLYLLNYLDQQHFSNRDSG
jgi:hypothetical protein